MKILRNACYAHPRRWTSARLRRYHTVGKRKTQKVATSNINTQSHIFSLSLWRFLSPSPQRRSAAVSFEINFPLHHTNTPKLCLPTLCEAFKLWNHFTRVCRDAQACFPTLSKRRRLRAQGKKGGGKKRGFGSVPQRHKGGEESGQRWDCRSRSSARPVRTLNSSKELLLWSSYEIIVTMGYILYGLLINLVKGYYWCG